MRFSQLQDAHGVGEPQEPKVERTESPAFRKWFGKSVVTANGRPGGKPLVVYHGTSYAGFKEFNPGGAGISYFAPSPEYAAMYTYRAASAIARAGRDEQPYVEGVYPLYLRILRPFDTRRARERQLFTSRFYMKRGNGAPLDPKLGLPDWTDAEELVEWFQDEGLDYDGLMLADAHGYLAYGVWNPKQIKSAIAARRWDPDNPDITEQQCAVGRRLLVESPEEEAVNRTMRLYPALERQTVDELAKLDPTPRKAYLPWMSKQYAQQAIRLPEDAGHLTQALERFERAKNAKLVRGPQADIMRYARLGDLVEMLDGLEGKQTKGEAKRTAIVQGARETYADDRWRIVKITTPEAADKLCRPIENWCVKDESFARNYLQTGPLTLVYKQGRPWVLLHEGSGQAKDTYDRPIGKAQAMELEPLLGRLDIHRFSGELRKLLLPVAGWTREQAAATDNPQMLAAWASAHQPADSKLIARFSDDQQACMTYALAAGRQGHLAQVPMNVLHKALRDPDRRWTQENDDPKTLSLMIGRQVGAVPEIEREMEVDDLAAYAKWLPEAEQHAVVERALVQRRFPYAVNDALAVARALGIKNQKLLEVIRRSAPDRAKSLAYHAIAHRERLEAEDEQEVARSGEAAAIYAVGVLHAPFPEAEDRIMDQPNGRFDYMLAHLHRPLTVQQLEKLTLRELALYAGAMHQRLPADAEWRLAQGVKSPADWGAAATYAVFLAKNMPQAAKEFAETVKEQKPPAHLQQYQQRILDALHKPSAGQEKDHLAFVRQMAKDEHPDRLLTTVDGLEELQYAVRNHFDYYRHMMRAAMGPRGTRGGRLPAAVESIVRKGSVVAGLYIRLLDRRRMDELLAELPSGLLQDAVNTLHLQLPGVGRLPAFEDRLLDMAKPDTLVDYAKHMGGAWPEAEKAIAEDADASLAYATDVLNGRFKQGEPAMIQDLPVSKLVRYAQEIDQRLPAAEDSIMKAGGREALDYTLRFLPKGERVPEDAEVTFYELPPEERVEYVEHLGHVPDNYLEYLALDVLGRNEQPLKHYMEWLGKHGDRGEWDRLLSMLRSQRREYRAHPMQQRLDAAIADVEKRMANA